MLKYKFFKQKPMMFGSNYIYIEFMSDINYSSNFPFYIIDNFDSNDTIFKLYDLPKYAMIKFKGTGNDIDLSYNILKVALNSTEWNVFINKIRLEKINK